MSQNDGNPKKQGRSRGEEPLDFGEFVSSNVQRTSDLLKGEAPAQDAQPVAAPAPRRNRPGGERTVERARDGSYWRRKAAGSGEGEEEPLPPPQKKSTRNRYLPPSDEEIDQFHDEDEFNNGGGGFGGFFGNLFSDDGDDGNRNRIIAAILAILLLLLIIWGLTRIFGGDGDSGDGEQLTPTPTAVVVAPSTPDEGPTDLSGETPTVPATDEPDIPRGGDNQRGDGGDLPVAEASAIAVDDMTSDVARACTGHCLVRVEGENQEKAIEEADARASWSDESISWIVVSPSQAEVLDRTQTLTLIENEPRTYNMYIVKTPVDHNQADVVSPHGEILDQTGRYYLVRWSTVPAVAKPVTDWGYAVFKIAPAPPQFRAEIGVLGPADQTTGADLMGQVDQGNVERLIDDLTHMGELDDSGLGSRYYTYPGNQIAADYLFQELESYGLTVWYEDFMMWDGYLLVNVVAEIPGADDSEVYAIMAHFDTMNTTNPRIAPGADDNASGISATLETVRILSQYQLNHPVRVAFVNAEEVGIVGAPAWARESNAKNVPVMGVFNVDSVGSIDNRPLIYTNATGESTWLQTHLSDINNRYGLNEDLQHRQTDAIVADDNFVRAEGIPAVMIAREVYGGPHLHHTDEDVMETMSPAAVVDTTYIVMLAVWELVA